MILGVGLHINNARSKVGAAEVPELITNGTDLVNADGWTARNAVLSASNGGLSVADAGSYTTGYQSIITEIGKEYKLTYEVLSLSGSSIGGWSPTEPNTGGYIVNHELHGTTGVKEMIFTATSTTTWIGFCSQGNATVVYGSISVKENV